MTDGRDEMDPEEGEALAALIGEAMREALRSEDPAALEKDVRRLLPAMVPRMAAAAPSPAALRSIESTLARAIWNAAPIPSNGYRPRPRPEPERNGPCLCGSGAKYKRCCALIVHSFPAIDAEAAWQALAARLPPRDAKALLDEDALPPEALAPLAHRALERGAKKKVSHELDRHLSRSRRDSRYEEAALLAIDLDADLRGPDVAVEQAMALARDMPRDLQASVFRHLVPFTLETGDEGLARELFEAARAAQPDHPDLALLEVSIALNAGELEAARGRASFWLAWMRRRGLAEEMAEVVSLLETTVRDPEAGRASLHEGPEGFEIPVFLTALTELVARGADRPPHPYGLTEGPNGVVLAAPPLAAKKAEAAWNKAWPGHKPNLVSFEAGYDRSPYDEAERWLAVLRRQAAALDNLSILDDLALLVEPIADGPIPALSDALLAPLLARALALIRASLVGAEGRRLEWAHVENRPALRLLSVEARRLDQAGRAADAAALYAWLLRLNPNDNHGHREWVINHHLRSGENQAALDVATAYPKDFLAPTVFGRALALWRLGPREAAEPVLRFAADDRPLVVRALLADEMAQPESDPNGLAIGGEEEAWIYREEMREAWQATPDALDYLRGLPPAPARGSRRARKTGKGR